MSQNIELKLSENSIDFLISAIENIKKEEDPRSWKYALVHLASANELLLKSFLEKEHWSLLFENINLAKKKSVESGEFKSVTFETCLDRLKNIRGMKFDERDEKSLRTIQTYRNRVVHSSFNLNLYQAKAIVAKGLNLFFKLPKLAEDDDADLFHLIEAKFTKELIIFDEFVNDRLKSIKSDLENSQRPNSFFCECPVCSQNALIVLTDISPKMIVCRFCLETFSPLKITERCGMPSGGLCPACREAVLGVVPGDNNDKSVCPICDFETDGVLTRSCGNCGKYYVDENHCSWCPRCLENAIEYLDPDDLRDLLGRI